MSRLFNQFYFEQTDNYYRMQAEHDRHINALWQDYEERRMEDINQELREESQSVSVVIYEDGYRVHHKIRRD